MLGPIHEALITLFCAPNHPESGKHESNHGRSDRQADEQFDQRKSTLRGMLQTVHGTTR
jgi:hypothetical protein